MKITRKNFLKKLSILTLGFSSFSKLLASDLLLEKINNSSIKLIKDPKGILSLPEGFSYRIISKYKNKMSDDLHVPNHADGMACFKGSGNNVVLVRNHELGHYPSLERIFKDNNPFGPAFPKYLKKNINRIYDSKKKKTSCFGCTTTIVYDLKEKKVKTEYLSLAGTLVNCSGGPTPWGSWISSEETVKSKGDGLNKNHGYNFEVKVSEKVNLSNPIPLKEMGRFRHEAVAVDPNTNFIYQTEDREDGLFYRFKPNVNQDLKKGGKLQALSLKDFRGTDCSNWKQKIFDIGQSRPIKWIDLEDVDTSNDDLRIRGKNKGCASFSRGEGIWYENDYVYFTATSGGKSKLGQIWRYKHVGKRGVQGELELFFESSSKDVLRMPDNITVAPWGDLIISEDGKGHDRLIGINPENSNCYCFAKNVLNKSEFAGATFSPDGKILFVNIYDPAMTIAIEGPWKEIRNIS